MADAMKRCSKCDAVKDARCFHRRAAAKDGLQPHCKDCQKAMQRERSKSDGWRASTRRWLAENPERSREHKRLWVKKNLDYFRDKAREQSGQLAPNYVKRLMRRSTPGLHHIPELLVEMKREQLLLRRLTRELVQELENHDGN